MIRKFNFESLAVAEKNQSIRDEQDYQNLLREIAAEKCGRSDEEVLEILHRAGRDGKTLEEDAAKRAERDRMIAEVKRLDELKAERGELARQERELREEFEKVEAEYEAKRNPLLWKHDCLNKTITEISRYRDTLFERCPDTQLKLELEILHGQWDGGAEYHLRKRQQEIEAEIRYAKQELDEKVLAPGRRERGRQLQAKIKEWQAEYQQIEVKKAELAKKKAEHDAAVAELRERMIFA